MVRELARITFVDPTQAIELWNVQVCVRRKADDRAALMSVRVKSGDDFTEREVRLYDKGACAGLLGKHAACLEGGAERRAGVRIVDDVPEAARDG